MSPCERVFSIAEVVENIFLELCCRDLLCNVQRICKSWKAIVDDSTPLQEALFNKPIQGPQLLWFGKKGEWLTYAEETKHYRIAEHPLITMAGEYMLGFETDNFKYHPRLTAIRRPEASWRNCLVTQPPITALRVERGRIIGPHEDGVMLTQLLAMENPRGFTPRTICGYSRWFFYEASPMRVRHLMDKIKNQ